MAGRQAIEAQKSKVPAFVRSVAATQDQITSFRSQIRDRAVPAAPLEAFFEKLCNEQVRSHRND